MYAPNEIVGQVIIICELYPDSNHNWFYSVKCKDCGEKMKVRSDRLKYIKHCKTKRARQDDLQYFTDAHDYIIESGKYVSEWRELRRFMADLLLVIGPRPSASHNLTRKDLKLPYGPENIKWETYFGIKKPHTKEEKSGQI